ncbi:hypothetical protein M408DRAFT_161702 [Serendipita vermifera MAFF 305830]|uniref:Uncharacterized protein n=1 Tax=Serendipita vermifera MAFF 305830 TaxID=933852 RepID=A0A0C3A5Y9_SERVB|nr:hypothetical protein M408DRAFT_161702 [Serendipita vermifera MAFF 305830]
MYHLLRRRVPVARGPIMALLGSIVSYEQEHQGTGIMAHFYLTANHRTRALVRDIWRKWDFGRDRAFPSGVERVWDDTHKQTKIIWKKSGKRFSKTGL